MVPILLCRRVTTSNQRMSWGENEGQYRLWAWHRHDWSLSAIRQEFSILTISFFNVINHFKLKSLLGLTSSNIQAVIREDAQATDQVAWKTKPRRRPEVGCTCYAFLRRVVPSCESSAGWSKTFSKMWFLIWDLQIIKGQNPECSSSEGFCRQTWPHSGSSLVLPHPNTNPLPLRSPPENVEFPLSLWDK